MNKIASRTDTAGMKRFFIFSILFPPLALATYTTPLMFTDGILPRVQPITVKMVIVQDDKNLHVVCGISKNTIRIVVTIV